MSLFEYEFPADNSPVDNTVITQLLLYFSKEEHAEVKRLCKAGMKDLFPESFTETNISDFLLAFLRKHYGTNSEQNNDRPEGRLVTQNIS